MNSETYKINVPTAVLRDLRQRLKRTRWPDEIPGTDWDYGANLGYIKKLVAYWLDGFDWRKWERKLNALPQFKANVDGNGIHFVHQRGKGPNPLTLMLIHGWPGSFFEMYKILGPLSDPGKYGGDPADAFHIVAPSLPGYGFSDRTRERGVNIARMADLFRELMIGLGYDRFGAQGGDWGSMITTRLGHAYPENLIGIHLNMVPATLSGVLESEWTDAERLYSKQRTAWMAEETGYSNIQGTRPQTLAYGLTDSPVGLAAWIVEKFRRWTDCGGDVESVLSKDELLTNIMIYWVTETINSSTRLYYEFRHHPTYVPRGERVKVPTGAALFPKEIILPPRETAERTYNIQRWTVMPSGGHFAALEKPQELVEDIRAFFRPLRG